MNSPSVCSPEATRQIHASVFSIGETTVLYMVHVGFMLLATILCMQSESTNLTKHQVRWYIVSLTLVTFSLCDQMGYRVSYVRTHLFLFHKLSMEVHWLRFPLRLPWNSLQSEARFTLHLAYYLYHGLSLTWGKKKLDSPFQRNVVVTLHSLLSHSREYWIFLNTMDKVELE